MTGASTTATFLFTDIEGSTRLWDRYPEAMDDAIGGHNGVLRASVTDHSGQVVKLTGDGVFARFEHAVATVLLAGAAGLRDDLGAVAGLPVEVAHREREKQRLRAELGAAFDDAWAEGQALDADRLADSTYMFLR